MAFSDSTVRNDISNSDYTSSDLAAVSSEIPVDTNQNDDEFGSSIPPKDGRRKRICRARGCEKLDKGRGYCKAHGGGKRCSVAGCSKSARGSSGLCIGHGGGPRCCIPGCTKSARTVQGIVKLMGVVK